MLLTSPDGAFQCVLYATQGCLPIEKGNMGSLAKRSPSAVSQRAAGSPVRRSAAGVSLQRTH